MNEDERQGMHFLLFVWDEETKARCGVVDGREAKTICNLDVSREEATLDEDKITCPVCRRRMINPFHRICLMI